MTLYELMDKVIMMDTNDIVVVDNRTKIVKSGSYDEIMDYAIENDVTIEGIGCYNGQFTIILD